LFLLSNYNKNQYGGVKASGFGREGLIYAIEDFTELKVFKLTLEFFYLVLT